jgi:perosamine synthetase
MINHSKPDINFEDKKAVNDVLDSLNLVKGKYVKKFENEFAKQFQYQNAIATSSGTYALVIGLKLLGIKSGDEVIIPTYVCNNVLEAVVNVGAIPIICDICDHWVVTPENVMKHINSKTKAIIIVHIYGIWADVDEFNKLGVPIVEDCCHSIGNLPDGRVFGHKGTMSFFSFHATKCLTTGEGGMLVLNDEALFEKYKKSFINKAATPVITDVQASLGLSQLNRYCNFLNRRNLIAEKYLNNLNQTTLTKINKIAKKTIFYRFPLITDRDINEVVGVFGKENIAVRRGVDSMLHRYLNLNDKDFPNSVNAFNHTLSIPIYPALTDNEVETIINKINTIL